MRVSGSLQLLPQTILTIWPSLMALLELILPTRHTSLAFLTTKPQPLSCLLLAISNLFSYNQYFLKILYFYI